MTQQKQNGNLVAIITMFFIFAMISFVTNLAAPFGTIWRNEYAGSNTLGMMGNMMNFHGASAFGLCISSGRLNSPLSVLFST